MTEPRCYWDGERPCSHDRGADLPRVRPLTNWMNGHECVQREEGVRWDGAPLEPELMNNARAQRARVRRWHDEQVVA